MEGSTTTNSNTFSSSGGTVMGSDAPSSYHMTPRTTTSENPPNHLSDLPPVSITPIPVSSATPPPSGTAALKKKRGRPRKYAPDGSLAVALSPKRISSSAPPPVIDFSAAVEKRGKVRSVASAVKMQQQPIKEANGVGDWVSCSVGANFTPHIITVNAGEDVAMKIMSFCQQGLRAICVLSANGVVSSVTLRQPDSTGGTLTYEGRFEILSLSGSFMPSESGGMRSRSGGMSVSLASPDGRVVGGGIAGLLVAASPVQIVVGSFVADNHQHEQKTKKQKPKSLTIMPPTAAVPISSAGVMGDDSNHHNSTWSSNFRGDSWSSMPADSQNNNNNNNNSNATHDINVTLHR